MQQQNSNNRRALEPLRGERLSVPVVPDLAFQRMRVWAFALMVLLLVIGLYLLFNTGQLLGQMQGRLVTAEDTDTAKLRLYNQQLETLQNRMSAFVADSVETKLKSLESSVTAGTVGEREIQSLEELRGQVKLLESYSLGKGGNLLDASRLEHARFQITPGSQPTLSGGDLLYEISQMKRLLYLGIASCSVVGFLLGGYWWQSHSRYKRLTQAMPPPKLLAGKLSDDT